jgi:hypothetical protein
MEAKNSNNWWGYSQENGWVVLDRNMAENQHGGSARLLFVKCSDWSVYKEKRSKWRKPLYISEDIYVSKLSFGEAKKIIEDLTYLKNEYQNKKENIYTQYSQSDQRDIDAIIEKHKTFMELLGKKPGSYRVSGQTEKNRRVTHCWSCKTHLDNMHDLECTKCGWIVCENCGACGCGRYN